MMVSGTPIRLADDSLKLVDQLELGDVTELGGPVVATGEIFSSHIFDYRGAGVTGDHAVFENGLWLRVRDSKFARRQQLTAPLRVHLIATEEHLLLCPGFIAADFVELTRPREGAVADVLKERLREALARSCRPPLRLAANSDPVRKSEQQLGGGGPEGR